MRLLWTGAKLTVALAAAVLAWNVIVGFVVNKPLYRTSALGTSYAPGSTMVQGREGHSRLTFDRWGYNNDDSPDPVDILVLGDSHTEALQVAREANYVSQTARLLRGRGTPLRIYNAGFSARSWADYLALGGAFVRTFQPRLTVVQVSRNDLGGDSIDASRPAYLAPSPSGWKLVSQTRNEAASGPAVLASQVPLAALLGAQLKDGLLDRPWGERVPFLQPARVRHAGKPEPELSSLVDAEMGGLKSVFGGQLVVLFLRYTPQLDTEGVQYENAADDEVWALLKTAAARWNIELVDTGPALRDVVDRQRRFPRGFPNTDPDSGHLNEYGHAAVASVLAASIGALR